MSFKFSVQCSQAPYEDVTSGGRLFQVLAAVTGKAWSPIAKPCHKLPPPTAQALLIRKSKVSKYFYR